MKLLTFLGRPAAFTIAIAIATAPAAAIGRDRDKFYPICAAGRTIYAPFPANNDESPNHGGVCHAARIDQNGRYSSEKPKAR